MVEFPWFLRKNPDPVIRPCAGDEIMIACGIVPVGVRPSIVPYVFGADGNILRMLNDGTLARLPSSWVK